MKNNQLFNVPNTEEGRLFVKMARKFIRKGCFVKPRGRGPRKSVGANGQGIKLSLAKDFAVYILQRKRVTYDFNCDKSFFVKSTVKFN